MNVRNEFPRPDFKRGSWQSLNGAWAFDFDWEGKRPDQEGLKSVYAQTIQVPFCYQSQMSGIGKTKHCPVVWYRREEDLIKEEGRRILLKFGAVDYKAKVWVNERFVGEHEGGYSAFVFDITEAAVHGKNRITVRVEDALDAQQPRGKQTWTGENFACWYTPVTGIWQSVWVEYVPDIYLHRVKITPDLERLTADVELFISSGEEISCEISAHLPIDQKRYDFGTSRIVCRNGYGRAVLAFTEFDVRRDRIVWAPDHPNLIDVDIVVHGAGGDDQVSTYFGMRSVKVQGRHILLNGEIFFQRLVLDQGYWKESLLTPPSEQAIVRDLELAKAMGFNGVRKHQKTEDPLFYYHADRMGMIVWGELPSAYTYNDIVVRRLANGMLDFIEQTYNHPCIITWVPVNESWGVRNVRTDEAQRSFVQAMTFLIKSVDTSRLVSGNDGWEQTGCTDICAMHDYIYNQRTLGKYHKDWACILESGPEKRMLFTDNDSYGGQPVILSEYGGIAFENGDEGWGYLENAGTAEEFLERIGAITKDLIQSQRFAGFCYTQLTDVQQEMNGLLNMEREPKADIDQLKAIFGYTCWQVR